MTCGSSSSSGNIIATSSFRACSIDVVAWRVDDVPPCASVYVICFVYYTMFKDQRFQCTARAQRRRRRQRLRSGFFGYRDHTRIAFECVCVRSRSRVHVNYWPLKSELHSAYVCRRHDQRQFAACSRNTLARAYNMLNDQWAGLPAVLMWQMSLKRVCVISKWAAADRA